jgi:hypothetical protein
MLPGGLELDQYASGDYWPVRSWAAVRHEFEINSVGDGLEIVCRSEEISKRLKFSPDGGLTVSYEWSIGAGGEGDQFAVELSLSVPLEIRTEPAAQVWTFPIETTAKSERGLDRTKQGDSVTLRWPAELGSGTIELQVPQPAALEHAQAEIAVSSPDPSAPARLFP